MGTTSTTRSSPCRRGLQAVPPAPAGSGPRNQPPRLAGAQPPEIWWPSDAGPLVMDGYYHGAGDSAHAVVSPLRRQCGHPGRCLPPSISSLYTGFMYKIPITASVTDIWNIFRHINCACFANKAFIANHASKCPVAFAVLISELIGVCSSHRAVQSVGWVHCCWPAVTERHWAACRMERRSTRRYRYRSGTCGAGKSNVHV